MKVIVFDLGGTLMEFAGMPLSWVDYYEIGFKNIAKTFDIDVSEEDIDLSVQIMKSYNPRVNYREKEYSAEYIFEKSLKHWNIQIDIKYAIEEFFNGMNLNSVIYDDSINTLKALKSKGYRICALTDIPSAMPDDLFKESIEELLQYIDFYVSSQSCGYRKPNAHGIELIAEKYNVALSDLVFVGDEEKDKLLAEKIGCKFYLIDRKGINKNADVFCISALLDKIDCRER